jgi:hypothetical protein
MNSMEGVFGRSSRQSHPNFFISQVGDFIHPILLLITLIILRITGIVVFCICRCGLVV